MVHFSISDWLLAPVYATFVAPVQQYSTETEPGSRQPSFNSINSRQPSFKQSSSEAEPQPALTQEVGIYTL